MMTYVQWSYDKRQWYSYGADAVEPPIIFDTLDEAHKVFDKLMAKYYAPHYRIVSDTGDVVCADSKQVD